MYFDYFFSSTNLMKMLLEQETYSCVTTRANRKNWPTEFRKPTVLKLKRETCSPPSHKFRSPDWWFGHKKNRKTPWRNWNCMSSSRHKLHEAYWRCWCKRSETRVLWCRPILKNGGNLYYIVLNVCLVNCFILYDLTNHPPSTAHGNRQLNFRRNFVRQLIGTFTSRKRTGRKRSLPIGTAFPNLFHTLQKISRSAKVCALCIEKKKKLHLEGVNRQHINVSSVPCFLEYREQRNVEVQN